MTRKQLAAASILAAATLITVATSPPYYGSWEQAADLDAQRFTLEAPEQAHDEGLLLATTGGLPQEYWGGLRLEVSVDAVQLQVPDQAQPDTGDTAAPIETQPLQLVVTLLEDGQEASRQGYDLVPDELGDRAITFTHYASATGCPDLGACELPFTLSFELDRPLQDGEVLVVDWGARGLIGGDFAEEGQPEPDLEIALTRIE